MPEAQSPPAVAAAAPAAPARAARRSLFERLNLEIRNDTSLRTQLLVNLGGLVVGLSMAALVLISIGVSPSALLREFVVAIVTSPRNLSAVIVYATPLIIVGLAGAIAFRAMFWNIGIDGQVIFGALGATLVANYDIGPEAVRLPLMGLAAALAGMLWILIPIVFKLRFRVNEIISTLLMNYIAFNFLLHLLYGPWKDPQSAFPHSKLYDAAERFSPLGWQSVNQSILLAPVLVAAGVWLVRFSRTGYFIDFVAANARMARAVGIPVVTVTLVAALASGALSGLAGFTICAGIDNRMTQSFFVGYGIAGVLIAFLARNNPLGVVFFALLMAVLMVAGQSLQVFYKVPFAMVQLIQSIIVMCVAGSDFFIRHRIRFVD
jgi:ABC-type uncharacterized transport system permease subunit